MKRVNWHIPEAAGWLRVPSVSSTWDELWFQVSGQHTDRQTDRQTYVAIIILRSRIGGGVEPDTVNARAHHGRTLSRATA